MNYLNQTDTYRCIYVNVEVAQTAREDVKRDMRAILSELRSMAATIWVTLFWKASGWTCLRTVAGMWL